MTYPDASTIKIAWGDLVTDEVSDGGWATVQISHSDATLPVNMWIQLDPEHLPPGPHPVLLLGSDFFDALVEQGVLAVPEP